MTASAPEWGGAQKFFLPNEDARPVRAALRLLSPAPRAPAFVGGSGMVLLDAVSDLPPSARATFVDVSPFQVDYFRALSRALEDGASPDDLRRWFVEHAYPELAGHYRRRAQSYPVEQVLEALRELFGIRFFFDAEALRRARAVARGTEVAQADITRHLSRPDRRHDFVYLSNVADYLAAAELPALFAACRRHRAPVYLLTTTACPDAAALRAGWEASGYQVHAGSASLDASNRGLGARALARPWNRPGQVLLLVPEPGAAAEAGAPREPGPPALPRAPSSRSPA